MDGSRGEYGATRSPLRSGKRDGHKHKRCFGRQTAMDSNVHEPDSGPDTTQNRHAWRRQEQRRRAGGSKGQLARRRPPTMVATVSTELIRWGGGHSLAPSPLLIP